MASTKKITIAVAALMLASAPAFAENNGTTLGGNAKDNSASGGSEASGTSKSEGAMTKNGGAMTKSGGAMSGSDKGPTAGDKGSATGGPSGGKPGRS